jgi:hypothetical protein
MVDRQLRHAVIARGPASKIQTATHRALRQKCSRDHDASNEPKKTGGWICKLSRKSRFKTTPKNKFFKKTSKIIKKNIFLKKKKMIGEHKNEEKIVMKYKCDFF